jgi:hypothetical protein
MTTIRENLLSLKGLITATPASGLTDRDLALARIDK